MPEISEQKILAGRKAVEAHRTAHTRLNSKPWHKGILKEHTPLLNIMLKDFKGLGFNTIQKFFGASRELNIQELEKTYARQGECNRCGECCKSCDKYLGDSVCAIQDNKPQICRDFPRAKDFVDGYIPEKCSYRFTKTGYESEVDTTWR